MIYSVQSKEKIWKHPHFITKKVIPLCHYFHKRQKMHRLHKKTCQQPLCIFLRIMWTSCTTPTFFFWTFILSHSPQAGGSAQSGQSRRELAVTLRAHHIAELTCVVLAEFYQSLLCFNVNHGRNPFFLFVWRPSSAVTNVPFAKVTWILHFSLFTSCRLLCFPCLPNELML